MPRKHRRRGRTITHCEYCGHFIGPDRGPAAKTCSDECAKARNCEREKKRYARVKNNPGWKETRADYLARIKQRKAADPEFSRRQLERHRASVRKHRDTVILADPERYAAYKLAKRKWWHSLSPERKAARKYWYGSLSDDLKRLYLAELRKRRAGKRLQESRRPPDDEGNPK